MNEEDFIDSRTPTQFYDISFSGYERKRVKNMLEMAMYEGKLSQAIDWMMELLGAGHLRDIWQACLMVYVRFVHLSSINVLDFLHQTWCQYKQWIGEERKALIFRNHVEIRNLFYQLVGVVTQIPKQNELISFYKYKITQYDFDTAGDVEKYQAPKDYLSGIFMEGDPLELYYPLNEFYYHLVDTQQKIKIYYWLDFLLEYYTKNKELCCFQKAHYRDTEMIWLIWSICKKILAEKHRLGMAEKLQILYEMCRKKRQPVPVFYYFLVEFILAPSKMPAVNLVRLIDNLPPASPLLKEAYLKLKPNEVMTGTMDKEKLAILWAPLT